MPSLPKGVEYFMGFDPGKTGALACLDSRGQIYCINKMPATETDLLNWFYGAECMWSSAVGLVEWIHPAIKGVGKSQMSKLYGNYTQLRMCCIAQQRTTRFVWEDVKPRKWQQGLGISPRKVTENRTQWKNRLKAMAQQLFPQEKVTLATADALLIATYCLRKHTGTL